MLNTSEPKLHLGLRGIYLLLVTAADWHLLGHSPFSMLKQLRIEERVRLIHSYDRLTIHHSLE